MLASGQDFTIKKVLIIILVLISSALEAIAAENKPNLRVKPLSFGSGDYQTELYILGMPEDEKRLNVMVQGCIHGDERSGREAGRILIEAYDEGRLKLTGLNLYVIPELNRPACRAGIRNFYPGADPSEKVYLRSNDQINMSRAWPTKFDEEDNAYYGSYRGRDYPRIDPGDSSYWHPPEVVEASVKIAEFVRKDIIPLVDGTSPLQLPRMDAVICLHATTYNFQYVGINLEGEVSARLYEEGVKTFSEDEIVGPEYAIPGNDCYFSNSALGIYGIIIEVATNRDSENGKTLLIPLREQVEETLRYLIGLINQVIPNTEMKSNPESPWVEARMSLPN